MWLRLIQYGAPALAVIALLLWVDNRGYDRGHDDAQRTCSETTVPAAEAAVQARCDLLTTATKEENDALYARLNSLRSTYDRLRRQKPISTCVPIPIAGDGDAGSDGSARDSSRMGISTEWLDQAFYDAASDIERGKSCQRQLARIYELNQK